MKTYEQLDNEDKKLAINYFQCHFLVEMAAGVLKFKDAENGNDWQARIDKIISATSAAHHFLNAQKLGEDKVISDLAFDMGLTYAVKSLYIEEDENAVELTDVRNTGPEHRHHANCNHKTH